MRLPGILRRARDNGISTLALETEGTASEADRLRARIEPFVEMLLSKRRNGA
jgi:benzoyl-CoA reductase/2-hydroxyglutaryl-CoA dehydratase subunit BcrC/BadD/HgdB